MNSHVSEPFLQFIQNLATPELLSQSQYINDTWYQHSFAIGSEILISFSPNSNLKVILNILDLIIIFLYNYWITIFFLGKYRLLSCAFLKVLRICLYYFLKNICFLQIVVDCTFNDGKDSSRLYVYRKVYKLPQAQHDFFGYHVYNN